MHETSDDVNIIADLQSYAGWGLYVRTSATGEYIKVNPSI